MKKPEPKQETRREVVDPGPAETFSVDTPSYVQAMCLRSTEDIDADTRGRLYSALSVNFKVADGVLTTSDGRRFKLEFADGKLTGTAD